MTWTRGEKYLAIGFVIGVCHHIDHVLRYDHSGWPFRPEVTPFTYGLLVYPIFLVAALGRRYPLIRITATALLFGFTTFAHFYFETPFDQYRTWAEGSPVPVHGIQHIAEYGIADRRYPGGHNHGAPFAICGIGALAIYA